MRALVLVLAVGLMGCFPKRVERSVDGVRVLTLQHDYANTHAVVDSKGQVLLIDSGLERNGPLLEADLRSFGLEPSNVKAVVLSHGHADHAGGGRLFQQTHGARIYAGQGDEAMLAAGKNEALCPTNDDARARLAEDQAEHYTPYRADVLVSGSQRLDGLELDAEVLSLPGHTAGSLVARVGQALFVGDLLRGSVFGSSAEVHFYMCDVPGNAQSIRALLARFPDVKTVYVGHFGPLTREAVLARFGAL